MWELANQKNLGWRKKLLYIWYDIQHWWSFTKAHDVCYKTRCYFWHKYNTVEAKTLPRTYVNPSELLPHMMFQILVDFIEKEKPYEIFNTEDSHNAKEWAELKALYDWWVGGAHNYDPMYDYDTIEHTPLTFKKISKDRHELIMNQTQKEKMWWSIVRQREEDFEWYLEKNMKRLCELRKMLWT